MEAVAVTFVVKYAFIVTAIVLFVYAIDAVLFPCNYKFCSIFFSFDSDELKMKKKKEHWLG